jgi:uncharacterized protein (DUF305 family)
MSLRRALTAAAIFAAGLVSGAVPLALWHVRSAAQQAAGLAQAGPVDVGFAQFMRMHHEQAVLMAQILLNHGDTPLAGLARAIESEQLLEIGQMKGWLQLWNRPLLPSTRDMDWMLMGRNPPDETVRQYVIDCRTAPGGMPGLATSDQLNQLRHLEGAPRDKLFLRLMLAHHQSALVMARFAALNAETPVVRNLAAQMLMQQSEEITVMAVLGHAH